MIYNFECETCELGFTLKHEYEKHMKSQDHRMVQKYVDTIDPSVIHDKIYDCDFCDFKSNKISSLNAHIRSNSHKIRYQAYLEIEPEIPKLDHVYECKNCNYQTSYFNNYNRHLKTKYHAKRN